MNRSFPGKERSNTTERMANRIYRRFVAQCDLGLDFHTSTQNRTTIYHARADLDNPEVRRLARAYATNVVLYGSGDEGRSGRRRPRTGSPDRHGRDGARTPVPAGAHREGVGGSSVLAEYELTPGEAVHWPGGSSRPPPTAQSGGSAPTPADSSRWSGAPTRSSTRARRSAPSRTTSKRRSTRSRPLRRADRRVAGEPGRRPRAPALSRGQTRRGDAPGDRTRDR